MKGACSETESQPLTECPFTQSDHLLKGCLMTIWTPLGDEDTPTSVPYCSHGWCYGSESALGHQTHTLENQHLDFMQERRPQ